MATELEDNAVEQALPTVPGERARSRPRSAIINAGWNAFATFWNISISFVLTPLLIHSLGTANYGVLLLIWSVTGVMGIASFGLGEATLRYVAHYYADGDMAGVNRVFRSTLTFYVLVCGAAAATLCVGAPWIITWMSVSADEQVLVAWLLRLSAISFFCNVITSGAFSAIPMALHRWDISSKLGMIQGVFRSGGFLVLAITGFGVVHLIIWDVIIQLAVLGVLIVISRRLLPSLRPLPSLSLHGLKEIFGYGVCTFLTHVFLTMYRESGKLLLGARIGPTSVAYFGTPDSVAYRIYMVLISGGETLLPRFSASRDRKEARDLLLNATWASLALSVVFLVPLAVVMPDLLRLWINPEFAIHSAGVGQMMALCYLAPAAFAPIATFFRGTGKPGIVTAVMAAAGITVLGACALLIPHYAVAGVGYAYVLSCVPWFVGLVCGWLYAFGRSSLVWLARSVLVPLLLGGVVLVLGTAAHDRLGALGWLGVFALGGLLASTAALLVFGADLALGGDPPSRKLLQRIAESKKVKTILRRIRPVSATVASPDPT